MEPNNEAIKDKIKWTAVSIVFVICFTLFVCSVKGSYGGADLEMCKCVCGVGRGGCVGCVWGGAKLYRSVTEKENEVVWLHHKYHWINQTCAP